MTLHEFLAAQGRTYRRARELQRHVVELAIAAEDVGARVQGLKLRAIGDRVWVIADRYIETLFEKVN